MLRIFHLLKVPLRAISASRPPTSIFTTLTESRHPYHFNSGVYGYYPKPDTLDYLNFPPKIPGFNDSKYSKLLSLIYSYRYFGHEKANLDAIAPLKHDTQFGFNLEKFGLQDCLQETFDISHMLPGIGKKEVSLSDIITYLDKTYCDTLSIEIKQLSENDKHWITRNFEEIQQQEISQDERTAVRDILLKSQTFDRFLGKKFPTVKRYSGEGAESMLVFMDELISLSAKGTLENIVLGMPHRGRLNLQTGVLGYPLQALFHKLKGNCELADNSKTTTGDILSHLFHSIDLPLGGDGRKVHLSMLPNPSHLEAVNAVALGKARAKQMSLKEAPYDLGDNGDKRLGDRVMCVLIHGDASFASQGVVAESFVMSSLPNFSVGGTVHVIVNNHLGYTTDGEFGRFAKKCTNFGDLANCPVIHVNGSDPEAVVRCCALAFKYRMEKRRDVIVDISCFRRWGHNELDEPAFTQPQMYHLISNRKTIPDEYAEKVSSKVDSTEVVKDYDKQLSLSLEASDSYAPPRAHLHSQWSDIHPASSTNSTVWNTGLSLDLLKDIGTKSVSLPDGFSLHQRLIKSHVESRLEEMRSGEKLNWATAEALAIGGLLMQGHPVRLSGQDAARGTFSQRHAIFVDTQAENVHIPLNNLDTDQANFEIVNSPLIEESVLGFEYGMSIDNPNLLVMWEAQFGDFFNCAQMFVDTYVSSGEAKWQLQSGLVMLLPHGYDGDGPEHSSCRIERFLQLCNTSSNKGDPDDVNLNVVFPTTPAQYFHVLRRQLARNFRKPLIVVGPKGLLRLPQAVSSLKEMEFGTYFQSILPDPNVTSPSNVTRGILCSGKHFYALDEYRKNKGVKDCVIIRVESLCPFPAGDIREEIKKYGHVNNWTWSQEEPENMGAWSYLAPRFSAQIGITPRFVGRPSLAAPAVGVKKWHAEQITSILSQSFQ